MRPILVISLALLLAACDSGGGGGRSTPVTTPGGETPSSGDSGTPVEDPTQEPIVMAVSELMELTEVSTNDTNLMGTDADGNFVRDDVDEVINRITNDPADRENITVFARASTRKLLVDTNNADAVYREAQRSANAMYCLLVSYPDFEETAAIISILNAAIYNNEDRLARRHEYQSSLHGTTLRATHDYSARCDEEVAENASN